MIKAYFDGSCEPKNPGGHAHAGYVYYNMGAKKKGSVCVGTGPAMSNNVAEWSGVIALLQDFLSCGLEKSPIEVYGDSNMVINQAMGKNSAKKKNGLYVPYYNRGMALLEKFTNINFVWIPRESNVEADKQSRCRQRAWTPRTIETIVPVLVASHSREVLASSKPVRERGSGPCQG